MTLTTYPLDNIDYNAADAALFHCTRSSGIYAGDDFSYSADGTDNTIVVQPGLAWMRISKFKGQVCAMKTETIVDMGLPDANYPRIDRVIIQFDANKNDTRIAVKKGSPSSNPYPPERSTTEALYELHLLEVHRKPGAVSITNADITDLRLDQDNCGLMAESVTKIDTSGIKKQADELLDDLRKALEDAGSGQLLDGSVSTKKLADDCVTTEKIVKGAVTKYFTTTLGTSWSGSGPYTQTVTVNGLLATDRPIMDLVASDDFATAQAQVEAYALIYKAVASADSLAVYALEKPTVAIPIQLGVSRK